MAQKFTYLCSNPDCNHRQYSNRSCHNDGINWDCEVCGDWTIEEGPMNIQNELKLAKKDSNMAVFFTLLLIAIFIGMGIFA